LVASDNRNIKHAAAYPGVFLIHGWWPVSERAVDSGRHNRLAAACFRSVTISVAAAVQYDFTIARQEVNFTGQSTRAMKTNGRLPGPSLRFIEGDRAVIASSPPNDKPAGSGSTKGRSCPPTITPSIICGAEYDTAKHWETRAGASYMLSKNFL
jgi:hypothetical protein